MSLAIFFSFWQKKFRGSCNSYELQLPLLRTIYFPTAPFNSPLVLSLEIIPTFYYEVIENIAFNEHFRDK